MKLKYYWKIYKILFIQDIKSKMYYPSDFVISILGIILSDLSGLIVFNIMFLNFSNILGWNYLEMLFMYGFSLIALTPVQCLFDNNWNLKDRIFSGEFIKYCTKPINIYFYFIFETFDLKGLGQLFMGIGIVVYSIIKMKVSIDLLWMLVFGMLVLFSSLFMASLTNFAAATSFWIINSSMVMVFVNKFREYAKYPVSIYPTVLKVVFTFFIPISMMAYYPCVWILKPELIDWIACSLPLYSIFLFLLSYKFWMLGARNYNGTGT